MISDSHYPSRLETFPYKKIKKYADSADYIFGMGDYDTKSGLDYLYGFGKEVYAVSGNMDDYSIKATLPSVLRIKIEEVNIGLIHGWGGHFGLREKIFKVFINDDLDLICYGHTHSSFFAKEHGVYFFNPGSIYGQTQTLGILEINKKEIVANIVEL